MATNGEGGRGGRGEAVDDGGSGRTAEEGVGYEATDRLPAPHVQVSGGASALNPEQGGFVTAGSGHINAAHAGSEPMDAQEVPPANPAAAAQNAAVAGGSTRAAPGNGAESHNPWRTVGSNREAEAANAANPRRPLIDGCVFKAKILADTGIDRDAEWQGYLGNEVVCQGVVAHFDDPENFLPRDLLVGYPERRIAAPTMADCRENETLVSNADIVGAVVGAAPDQVHHMTDEAWTFFQGLLSELEISGYNIVGLTSGIDLSSITAGNPDNDRRDEEDLAVLQGNALARTAALAVRTGLPLVLTLVGGPTGHVDPFTWALEILHQVHGWTREHKVVISQFWGTPVQASHWLLRQPWTWFGITSQFVADAMHQIPFGDWLKEVPWGFLYGESTTPIGASRLDSHTDPALVMEVVSSLSSLTEESQEFIYLELARSAVRAYDLEQDHPGILTGFQQVPSMDYKASQEDYLRALARRALGPIAAQPDAISRVVIPPAPRGRRVAARARPPAPAQAVLPNAAGNQAAPVAPIVAAPAAQASVLPIVPFQQAEPPLAQATTFDVSDQTNKGWELNRMCPDHHNGPRGKKMRTHPTVDEIIPRYGKLTQFPNDEGMRVRAGYVGRRVIYSPHHMLVVIAAGRILRQEEFRARTIAFLDIAMNIDNPNNLVVPTTDYFRNVRERAQTSHEEALRDGKEVGDLVLGKYAFAESDTTYLTQFWVCRCQTGNDYFYANLHGPVVWQTVGYDQCGDNEVRQSFDVHVRNFFPRAINLTRHREYVQHVLKRVKTPKTWPPMPPALSVDLSKCLWSQTVVFMDEWASNELSRGLRRDVTCIGLPQDPEAANEKLINFFFSYAVQRIVIFYGAVALYEGYEDDVATFFNRVSRHLARNFGRARVYLVCPPYMQFRHDSWDSVVRQAMLGDMALQDLATMVSYPLDRQLWRYFNVQARNHWPVEAGLEQDKDGNLTDHGVAARKSDAVATHGLDLWSGLTHNELSQDAILAIARTNIYEAPHQFGEPTVRIPNYRELLKPKKKEALPSKQQAPTQTPPAPQRPAEQQERGSRSASAAKRGKGNTSQASVRSDQAHVSGSDVQGTPMLSPDPGMYALAQRLIQPETQALLREIIANAQQASTVQSPPAYSLPSPRGPTVAFAAKSRQERKSRSLSRHVRATSPWPSENKHLPYSAPADDEINDDDMVIEDLDVGRVSTGTRSEQDPATPTDTVSTVTSAAESSAKPGTSSEAASKSSTTSGSDSSSAAATFSSPSTTITTPPTSSAESASTASTSTSTGTTTGTSAPSTTSRTSSQRSSVVRPKNPFSPKKPKPPHRK